MSSSPPPFSTFSEADGSDRTERSSGSTASALKMETIFDVKHNCDLDIDHYSSYKSCLEKVDLEKLSAVLESLKYEIPLVPRLGKLRIKEDSRRRVLLGLSTYPSEWFLSFPEVGEALNEIARICKAHNQQSITRQNLQRIYTKLPDGATILYDFLVVCPMYEFAQYLQREVKSRVYFYVFVAPNSSRITGSMSADHFAFINEAENFVIKSSQINFQLLLRSFIHDTSLLSEWEPQGAHFVFNSSQHITRGFRERICDEWRQIFNYQGIAALQ